LSYLTTWLIATVTPSAPGLTLALAPSRSPAAGLAAPDFDTRAPTMTSVNADNLISGIIAIESSSEKLYGRSFTCTFTIASGMRGPCAARAYTNTVSSGAARARNAASSVTVPLTRPVSGFAATVFFPVDSALASAIPALSACASSPLTLGRFSNASQWRIADL